MSNQNTCTTENCEGTARRYNSGNVPDELQTSLLHHLSDTPGDFWLDKCQKCQFNLMERAHREFMWGENGTNTLPAALMPEPPEENAGWDVCQDVDDEFEN